MVNAVTWQMIYLPLLRYDVPPHLCAMFVPQLAITSEARW
jgi:hypothetical protein